MTLSRDQNIFGLKNMNSSTDHYYNFGGHWENKNWKNDNNTVETTTRVFSSLTGFIFPQWKYTFQWNWQEISKSCHVSFFQKLLKAWKGSPSLSTAYLFISCLHWAIVWNILACKRHHHAQHNNINNIESQTLWNWMLTLFYPFSYKWPESKSGQMNMTSHPLNTKSLYCLP